MDYQHPRLAEIYDIAYPRDKDTDFYVSLAGPRSCSVHDLGCGAGVLCCALAERRHQVTGVDPASAMLAIAKRKLYAERVEWIESPAQSYRSQRRFDLIVMTGHAFQVLLTDADALGVFATMRSHLRGRGKVVFETRNPPIDWAGEWAQRPAMIHMLPNGEVTETLEGAEKDGEFISFRTCYRFPHTTLTTDSRLRFPSRERVESLVSDSCLVVRAVLGDWSAGPFQPERSREMIFLAEMASGLPDE